MMNGRRRQLEAQGYIMLSDNLIEANGHGDNVPKSHICLPGTTPTVNHGQLNLRLYSLDSKRVRDSRNALRNREQCRDQNPLSQE
jgi:hypothetical protein